MWKFLSLALVFALVGPVAKGQKTESFFNWAGKSVDNVEKARFYTVSEKKDSLWEVSNYYVYEKRLEMKGSYKDSAQKIPHGEFTWFYVNGKLSAHGRYSDKKKQGPWTRYHFNGLMLDTGFYKDNKAQGLYLRWHSNGFMSDSIAYGPDGTGVCVRWFDDGTPSEAGRLSAGDKKQGKWQFFDKNQILCAEGIYEEGKIMSMKYFKPGGELMDTTGVDREAKFPGDLRAWQKYLSNRLDWPSDLRFKTEGQVTVVVNFSIVRRAILSKSG